MDTYIFEDALADNYITAEDLAISSSNTYRTCVHSAVRVGHIELTEYL
jgi:hypothetical protein